MSEKSTNDPPAEPSTSSGLTEEPPSSEAQVANLETNLETDLETVLETITLEQIESVRNKLHQKGMIKVTPCELTRALSKKLTMLDINCYMKFEMLQDCGSCIARGAAYAILQHLERHSKKPIISASLGNFAIALAYYAPRYEIPITVVVPKTTPLSKIILCQQYLSKSDNSKVIILGENLRETVYYAKDVALIENMIYIEEDHPDVIIGQTSVGLDILDDIEKFKNGVKNLENVKVSKQAGVSEQAEVSEQAGVSAKVEVPKKVEYDNVIMVPIKNGSLIAAVAMAVKKKKPNTLVIGIEAEISPSFSTSREAGEPVQIPINFSAVTDELAIPKIGAKAFSIANTLIDGLITVTENWITAAMIQIIEHEGYTAEGSGAMCLAAILYGDTNGIFKTQNIKNVVLLVTDGNLDPTIVEKCLQVGLYTQKRFLEFTVQISDQPKCMENLLKKLSSLDIFIYKIEHKISSVQITIETKDELHAAQVEQLLNKDYAGWSGFCLARQFF